MTLEEELAEQRRLIDLDRKVQRARLKFTISLFFLLIFGLLFIAVMFDDYQKCQAAGGELMRTLFGGYSCVQVKEIK